jgi:hypothetical protein
MHEWEIALCIIVPPLLARSGWIGGKRELCRSWQKIAIALIDPGEFAAGADLI